MADKNDYPDTEQTYTTMRPPLLAKRHMAVSGHNLATHAAMRILDRGGNAVDAGLAGMLCLAVVQPDMVSFAGVAPMLIHAAKTGENKTVSGLGVWPKAATTEFFITNHGGKLPEGILRSVTPGAPDACFQALARYGTMRYADIAADALELARDGFPVHKFLENGIRDAEKHYRQWPENSAIFLPGDRVPLAGEIFVQKDLASTIQAMIDAEAAALATGATREQALRAARDTVYTGPVGRAVTDFHAANGGLLTQEDMAAFSCDVEDPLSFQYGEYTILTHGAWCQGPVLPMVLNILRETDLAAMGHNSAEYIHTLAEAFKLAFADRERLFGDPKFVDVPLKGLLSPEYGARQRAKIKSHLAWESMPPSGDPFAAEGRAAPAGFDPSSDPASPPHTTHALDTSYVCVVDRWGNVFSATPSDMTFDTQIIPGTGLAVSSRGSQSRIIPGHPSRIEPGKRPRLTPTGCLILRRGKPWLILGTPGGDVQCQTNLQVLLNVILFSMNTQEAVEAPRFAVFNYPNSFYPHTYAKGVLRLESRISDLAASVLAAKGHTVKAWPDFSWNAGGACMIMHCGGYLAGGSDPRRECLGMGW
ncbi:putative gamma-glutamyltranspeptidase [uncultured delta proteobacterium]|uniref:Putative gamma-glutamyltranspeptidase n=1 Tax=uncultured delta proteobacterium TaxID=34034 RepID=A0A212JH89_9DELT|nr:putative gamma-glutamyltranspeptidase [uncultured delta proteobacterium]